ncbi:MAG: hypothetical protein BroJett038_20470 [Chloroflexota bacterium]|nr:hypothetical protein [Anaerolineae bacterium CFX8]GIL13327.1 MAG: hypothetical protein BroJett038_20470 [Chloroflexota bacterium]
MAAADLSSANMVGRVLRASTRGFTCGTQSNKVGDRHDFGAFVSAPIANDDSVQAVGLIYAVEIKDDMLVSELVMAEAVNSSIMRDQRENRMVPLEISVLSIGYIYRETIVHSLPPRPPMTLSPVELCSAEVVYAFTQRLDFLPLALNASEVPSDDLLGAAIRYAARAYPENEQYDFLVRCGREIARQLSHDLKRLEHVLALIRPSNGAHNNR